MAAASEYISAKNRNVAISRTAQVDNHFLGNMSTGAWGFGRDMRTVTRMEFYFITITREVSARSFTSWFQLRYVALFPRAGQRLL